MMLLWIGYLEGVAPLDYLFLFFTSWFKPKNYSRKNKDTKNRYVLINKLYLIGDELIQLEKTHNVRRTNNFISLTKSET